MSDNVGLLRFRVIMRDIVDLVQQSPPGQQREVLIAKIADVQAHGEDFYGGGRQIIDSPMSSRMS